MLIRHRNVSQISCNAHWREGLAQAVYCFDRRCCSLTTAGSLGGLSDVCLGKGKLRGGGGRGKGSC